MKIVGSVAVMLWLSLAFPVRGTGALVWEAQEARVNASLEDRNAKFVFNFKNTGETVVSIKRVETSCGCAEAVTDKTEYAPGESGQLKVTVQGRFRGQKARTIIVKTNDESVPVVKLTAVVVAPELVVVNPATISWAVGDRNPKSVLVRVVYRVPFRIMGVKSGDSDLSAKLDVVREGYEYKVLLIPPVRMDSFTCYVSLITDLKIGTECEVISFAAQIN